METEMEAETKVSKSNMTREQEEAKSSTTIQKYESGKSKQKDESHLLSKVILKAVFEAIFFYFSIN